MFSPHNRRIAPLIHSWPTLMRGQLMSLYYDKETSGLTDPYETEHGDCLVDIAGNYYNSGQIFIQMPEWGVPEVGAAHLQRLKEGPFTFFDKERAPYWDGIASVVGRMEDARFAFADIFKKEDGYFIDGVTEHLVGTRHYSTSKGQRTAEITEEVIPVPFMHNGEVAYHYVRYHPHTQKLSLRISEESEAFNYWIENKNFYIDKDDNSKWISIDPMLNLVGFNNRPYDLGVARRAVERAGFTARDTAFLTRRAKTINKQRGKFTHQDGRDLLFAVTQFGPQDERALKLAELVDERGNVRSTEALSQYLEANQQFADVRRFAPMGARMPNDGSLHDTAFDHGAHYDAAGTAAIVNIARDTSPEIAAEYDRQTNAKSFYLALSKKGDIENMPIWLLPRREAGLSHSHSPYYYLGGDDQIGGMGQHVFLLVDGSLHTKKYKDKPLIDLSIPEWKEYLSLRSTRADPDSPVLTISENRMKMAVPIEMVLKSSYADPHWRNQIPSIMRDCNYLLGGLQSGDGHVNFPMGDNIFGALEDINESRKFESHFPQVPSLDDMLYANYIELPWLVDEREKERRDYKDNNPRHKDGEPIPGSFHTIHGAGWNVFQRWMYEIDDVLRDFGLKALRIDKYRNPDVVKSTTEEQQARDLNEFVDLMDRTITKLRSKNKGLAEGEKCLYEQAIREMINPATGAPYFKGNAFKVGSLEEAVTFRKEFGKRMMDDYVRVLKTKGSFALDQYAEGYVDKYFCMQTVPSGKDKGHILILPANADNGARTGATPQVVDEAGRHRTIADIRQMEDRDVIANIMDKSWDIRFRRDPNEIMIARLVQRYHNLGWESDIPIELEHLYRANLQTSLWGWPNETPDTARAPTLETRARKIESTKLNAPNVDPVILERSAHPKKGITADLAGHQEWEQSLILEAEWNKRRARQFPHRDAYTILTHHEEDTGLPLDFIPHQVLRDESKPFSEDPNFFVIDVPARHLRNPIHQLDNDYHTNMLVVRDTLTSTQKRQINDVLRGKSSKAIVLREIESGHLYTTGQTTVKKAPPLGSGKYAQIMEKAQVDYTQSGDPLSEKDKLVTLEVEGIFPLANTRNLGKVDQAFYLPQANHTALYAPELMAMGTTPITAIIMPSDYQVQNLHTGKLLRLWETDGAANTHIRGQPGAPTGRIHDTILRDHFGVAANGQVEGVALKDFLATAKKDDRVRDMIIQAGYSGPAELERRMMEWAVDKWKEVPMEQPIFAATFDAVNQEYREHGRDERYNMAAHVGTHFKAAKAAIRRPDKLVSPTASPEKNHWENNPLALQG